MSKTIYYLGAGASFGKRDESKNILEGLPIVSEIPSQFDEFREFIYKADIPEDAIYTFHGYINVRGKDLANEKLYMLNAMDELRDRIQEHATIDTYARKLYLIGDKWTLDKLKCILSLFFIWEQLGHKTDNRYDTFLANVLEAKTLTLPKDISILSWNYDSQIEIAYSSYRKNPDLTIYEKNIQGQWPQLTSNGRIFKVNGSATLADGSVLQEIMNSKEIPIEAQLIHYYSYAMSDTSQLGIQFKTHLSFAWEDSKNQKNMNDSIAATVKDAEQIVVIGYSFPFFNRETDRAIFDMMPNLKKIYVQDINADAVIQSLSAVIPLDSKIKAVPVRDCAQFYLPAEL